MLLSALCKACLPTHRRVAGQPSTPSHRLQVFTQPTRVSHVCPQHDVLLGSAGSACQVPRCSSPRGRTGGTALDDSEWQRTALLSAPRPVHGLRCGVVWVCGCGARACAALGAGSGDLCYDTALDCHNGPKAFSVRASCRPACFPFIILFTICSQCFLCVLC